MENVIDAQPSGQLPDAVADLLLPQRDQCDAQTYDKCLRYIVRLLGLQAPMGSFEELSAAVGKSSEKSSTAAAHLVGFLLQDKLLEEAPAGADILRVCIELAVFLMGKNIAYGNSALDPLGVMSAADPTEQIRIRMDDKLSRLVRGRDAGEDPIRDLVGYWVLLQVAES